METTKSATNVDEFSDENVSMISETMTMTTEATNETDQKSFNSALLFQCAVIAIAMVGIIANGLVLGALAASKDIKKEIFNVLFVNQMSLDLYSSVMLVITFFMRIFPVPLIGSLGYALCVLIYGETLLWFGLNGSMLNLACITAERYVKIVFPIWHKKRFRAWMVYAAAAFPWIIAAVVNMAGSFPTTGLVNGSCWSWSFWPTEAAKVAYAVIYFIFYFFNLVVIFVYCYGHILVVVRRQARVMQTHQSHGGPSQPTAAQIQSQKMQANVIKTVISLTSFFVICWCPNNVYYLLQNVANVPFKYPPYYVTVFLGFLNVCGNPFIYATKYDVVKKKLKKVIGRGQVTTITTT